MGPEQNTSLNENPDDEFEFFNGTASNGSDVSSSAVLTLSQLEVWGWAFLFVTVINLSSIMGILIFPLMKKSYYTVVMRTMIGLAIGSLSGSALFHLLPEAYGLEESRYVDIAAFVWLSAWIVMVLECVIKIVVKARMHGRLKSSNDEPSLHNIEPLKNPVDDKSCDTFQQNGNGKHHADARNGNGNLYHNEINNDEESKTMMLNGENNQAIIKLETHISRSTASLCKLAEIAGPQHIKTVAWIIIIGDSLNNFIDGVSIGAGFSKSFNTGSVLSLAIICEEFPHELGDFAILVNSGLTVKQALLFNFLSALTCYLGMILGIILGTIEWESYIFAFAAGIFLYVALGDMVPEVTNLIDEVSDVSPRKAWTILWNHNLGIFIGIAILYSVARFQ